MCNLHINSLNPVSISDASYGLYGRDRKMDALFKTYRFKKACLNKEIEKSRDSEEIEIYEISLSNRTISDSNSKTVSILYHDNEFKNYIYENEKFVTSIYESAFETNFIHMCISALDTVIRHVISIKNKRYDKNIVEISNKKHQLLDLKHFDTILYIVPKISKYDSFFTLQTDDFQDILLNNKCEVINKYNTLTGDNYIFKNDEEYLCFVSRFLFLLRNMDWFSDFLKFEYSLRKENLNFKSMEIPKIKYNQANDLFYIENTSIIYSDFENTFLVHSLTKFLKDNLDTSSNTININISNLIVGKNFYMYITDDNDKNITSYIDIYHYINLVNCNDGVVGKTRQKRLIEKIIDISDISYTSYRIFRKKDNLGNYNYICIIKLK